MNQTQDTNATGSAGPTPDSGPRIDRDSVRELNQLRRSREDRYIAGVAGGLGRHFGIDPTIIRVLLVALCIVGGAGLLLYGAFWLFVPDDGEERAPIHLGDELLKVVLIGALVIAALSILGSGWWWGGDHGVIWPLGILAVIVAVVMSASNRHRAQHPSAAPASPTAPTASAAPVAGETLAYAPVDAPTAAPATPYGPPPPATPVGGPVPPRPAPRPRRTGLILFWPTLALIALGFGLLGVYAADHHVIASAWPALALAITGVMLLVGAFVGRPGGLIFLGLITLPALMATSVVDNVHWEQRTVEFVPPNAASVDSSYRISNGKLLVDLSRVHDPAALAGRTISVRMGAGDIQVLLPRGVNADVDASLGFAGDIELGGREQSGFSPRLTRLIRNGGALQPPLHLDVHGRVGHIDIERN